MRQAQFLLKPFQDIMGAAPLKSAEWDKDTTEADWEAEILRIAGRGDMRRALDVYCRKFQCGDVGFKAFLALHQQKKGPSAPVTATSDAPKVSATADRPPVVSEVVRKRSPEASPKKPAALKITPMDAVKPQTRDEQHIINLLNHFSEKSLLRWLRAVALPKSLTDINVLFGTPPLMRSLLNHLTNDAEKTSLFVTCLANNADLFQKAKLTQCAKPLKKGDNGPFLDEAKTKLINLVAINEAIRHDLNSGPCPQSVTLAHIAARLGLVDVLATLCELSAEINKATIDGVTPAYLAALVGHVAVLVKLKELGADMNKSTSNGATPAHIAAREGHVAVLAKLHELGADINKSRTDGATPAYITALHGQLKAIKYLLTTPNHAESFSIPCVSSRESLLEDWDQQQNKGITIQMLLKIDERLAQGDDASAIALLPIDIAQIMGHGKIVELLRKHRPSPRVSSSFFNDLPQNPSAATNLAENDSAPTNS